MSYSWEEWKWKIQVKQFLFPMNGTDLIVWSLVTLNDLDCQLQKAFIRSGSIVSLYVKNDMNKSCCFKMKIAGTNTETQKLVYLYTLFSDETCVKNIKVISYISCVQTNDWCCNLLSSLLRCGIRAYQWDTQWDLHSLV